MKELDLIKDRIGIPTDFLTTVTCNTFRPEYYFSKADVVEKAVAIHRNFVARDPQGYKEAAMKALPIMLDVHKVLSAIYLWDNALATDDELVAILSQVRPDHLADFWISIKEHRKVLGLKHKSLSASARKLLWKFFEHVAETRRIRTLALWLMKNRKTWNKAFYYTHTKLENPDLELLVAMFAFGRQRSIDEIEDGETLDLLKDVATVNNKRKNKDLTMKDIKESRLPYRMIEGYASGQLDTTTKEWYWATFDKMTNYEILRRTDAMQRAGFINEYPDLYEKRIIRAARWIEPVAIASVILQHPDLECLDKALEVAVGNVHLNFPKDSVMLCDGSRSMKLKKTRPQPRILWELTANMANDAGLPTYIFNDQPIPFAEFASGKSFLYEGAASGPTSISRALKKAKEHNPEWIFIVSDMQDNIPYRGHSKLEAKKVDAAIVTLNPTINPLEPEAATRLGTDNEIFLPINGLRQFEQIVEVLKE